MLLNALVVEDEEYVRKSIVCKVDWDKLGIHLAGEAENGIEALRMMDDANVNIIITDIRMPGMDGLTMIKKAKEKNEKLKFIIVSGYNEFEYARKAINYNVTDYILKPVKAEHLEKTLSSIKDEIISEMVDTYYRSNLEMRFSENSELLKNYYFIKLLQDNLNKTDLQKYIVKLKDEFLYPNFIVSILRIISSGETSEHMSPPDRDTETVVALMKETYSGEGLFVFNNIRRAQEWIVVYNFNDEDRSQLHLCHKKLIEALQALYELNCVIAVGSKVAGLGNVKESYAQAEIAAKDAIVRGINRVIFYHEVNNHVKSFNCLTTENEKAILFHLENGETQKLQCLVREICMTLVEKKKGISYVTCYNLALEIFVTIKKFIQRNSMAEVSEVQSEPEFFMDLMKCFTINEVIRWCEKCIIWFESYMIDDNNASGREIVRSIRKYILNNYGHDMTLNSIAEKFHLNPNYLSRAFKVYSDENFNAFLTKVRMEKAMDLVMNSELTLNSISEITGYDDPKYFSRVFKKYYGISPSRLSDEYFELHNP